MKGMNSHLIMALETLPLLVLVGGSVWAALAQDTACARRRRLVVWAVAWAALAVASELEIAMQADCKCCKLSLPEELGVHAFMYGVLAAGVVLVGSAVYYPVRWVVQR